MIFKRMVANLRAQNWFAIAIELAIVIVGVFIAMIVANANQQRLELAETRYRLEQLRPELHRLRARVQLVRQYYKVTRQYAQVAFSGWERSPDVNDNDFIIASYQASQIVAMASTSQSWSTIVGAEQLRNIDDPKIREPMLRLMTFPEENLGLERIQSQYREQVRSIIPDEIQEEIRKRCGDYFATRDALEYSLPESCSLKFDTAIAAATAADLRRHPELVRELRLHLARISSFLNDVRIYDTAADRLGSALDR